MAEETKNINLLFLLNLYSAGILLHGMNKLQKLPSEIKVKVIVEKSGVHFAELVDYGVFTEADSPQELIFNINDLIHCFFDIPKRDRTKIWYMPKRTQIERHENFPVNPVLFHVLTNPQYRNSDLKWH